MGETTHQGVGETTRGRRAKRLRVGGRNDSRNGGRNDSGGGGAKRLRANGKVGETTRYQPVYIYIGIVLSMQRTTKAQMPRLVCAFVICIWQKQVFS